MNATSKKNPVGFRNAIILLVAFLLAFNISYGATLYEFTTTDNNFSYSNAAGEVITSTYDCAVVSGSVESVELSLYSNGTSDFTVSVGGESFPDTISGGPSWRTYTLSTPIDCTSGSLVVTLENATSDPDEIYWWGNTSADPNATFACSGGAVCTGAGNIRINGSTSTAPTTGTSTPITAGEFYKIVISFIGLVTLVLGGVIGYNYTKHLQTI